jgi:TonB-dependent starch-binding outer membrane protein SusC
MFRKLLSFALVGLFSVSMAYAQSATITGTIIDSRTGEELPGANVLVVELNRGSATNIEGEYEISNVPFGTYTFRVTFIGYRTLTQTVEVNSAEEIFDFEMRQDFTDLDEVVVSGIASQTSRAVSQVAVSKIDAERLQESNQYQDITQLLAGKAAGVSVSPSSGNPGGGIRFRVRSGGGLGGDGQPIIYIDGTRVDNAQVTGFGVGGQGIGVLSDLNPNDIESIDFLKGPAAAALYGTSGSNGVVLITTKSGRDVARDQVQVNVRSIYGLNMKQKSYERLGILSAEEADEVIDGNPFYDNTISVSGGTNTVRYSTNLSQRYEEGLGPDNTLDRQSFRGNLEAFPNEKLTVSVNTNLSLNEQARPQNDNNIFGYLGNLILAPGGSTFIFTPEEAIREGIEDENITNRFVGSVAATFTPIPNLNISGSIGYDGGNFRQTQFFSPNFSFAGIINGERAIFDRTNRQFTYDANASYTYNITPDFQATSVVGTQIFNRKINTTFQVKNDFPSSAIKNVGSGAEFINSDEGFLHTREAGVFSQHDFAFKDTYFFSVGGRVDFASAIGADAPAIFYPQGRISVRLDQFDFLPNTFELFKFRAAYGETGQLPGIFDGVNLLFGAAAFAVGRGLTIEEVGNPDIEPERVKEFEVGLDADFLEQYGLEFTYYRQWAKQSIIGFQEAPSTGLTFDNRELNVGGINGWGLEAGLSGSPIVTRNTQLDLNLLWSYQWNEVKDLGGAQAIFDGFDVNVIEEGLPRSAFYVNEVNGALRDDNGDVVLRPNGLPAPDVSAEREFLGVPFPEHNGSLSINFRFLRNFSLYQLWDWQLGLSVYNNTRIFQILFGNDQGFTDATEAFAAATPGTEEFDRLADKVANLDARFDGNFIEDADFVKLRELSLSYNFTDVINRTFLSSSIRNLTLGVSGRNLITITDYSGIDPEVNFTGARSRSQGADFLTLQTPRVVSGTLNIGF